MTDPQRSLAKTIQNVTDRYRYCTRISDQWGDHWHWGNSAAKLQACQHNPNWHPIRLTQKKILKHLRGEETVYFTGASRRQDEYCMAMIDIDVQKSKKLGSKEGAAAFAKDLQTLFPNLHCERSNGGLGMSCYLFVKKFLRTPEEVREALAHLQSYLEQLATNYDVEKVEVKGQPGYYVQDRFGVTTQVNMGQLARMPRGDVRNTFTCSLDFLNKLPQIKIKKNQTKVSGSLTYLPRPYLDDLADYRKIAGRLICEVEFAATGTVLVTKEDVAIALMCLHYFTDHPNRDGSLPHARFAGLWNKLFQEGIVTRQFDNKRFAAIRNQFSKLGLIQWEDSHYQLGQACKWTGSEKLLRLLDKTNNNNIFTGDEPVVEQNSWLRPVPITALDRRNWHLSINQDEIIEKYQMLAYCR